MAYLYFNDMNYLYDESASTMGRQIVDNFAQLFDADSWTSTRKNNEKFLQNKRDYFDSLFIIDGHVKGKLTSWIKRIPDVFYLPEEQMKKFLGTIDQHQETHGYSNNNSVSINTYTVSQTKALTLQQKARETNNKNSFTNATCLYPFKIDKKVCLLFFTFDSDAIYTVQILTSNDHAHALTTQGFDIVEIPEWDEINPREYKNVVYIPDR